MKYQINNSTTWGSRNAEDMYAIAVNMAGFDPIVLMKVITIIQKKKGKVNETTVCNAMQIIKDVIDKENPITSLEAKDISVKRMAEWIERLNKRKGEDK